MGETAAISNQNCIHCGMLHQPNSGACPRIRAIEYYPDGSIKRIEYHSPATQGGPFMPLILSGDCAHDR